jgi:hypothetical protein
MNVQYCHTKEMSLCTETEYMLNAKRFLYNGAQETKCHSEDDSVLGYSTV